MRKDLLIIALGLIGTAGTAVADVVSMPETQTTSAAITLPAKGISMSDVTKQFGEPRAKQPTVGGDTPKHPPITRWDYDGFAVIFEKDRVIDAVVPGAPPRLHNTAGLTPAPDAPPPPVAPTTELPDEPIVPQKVTPVTMPPPEPAAEAAPVTPVSPPPPEPAPPAEEPPPPEPPAEKLTPAPIESPSGDGPPTPK